MSSCAIEIRSLSKTFKGELGEKATRALSSLDLDVGKGEVYAFLGPNGAGKTTAIKLMMRLIFPTSGTIAILGEDNSKETALRQVGYLPEQPRMYEYLSGREFLSFVGQLFGLDKKEQVRRIDTLLHQVGLRQRGDSAIRSYSRGMMQRLGLAQALINDPAILILDEPMASLDPGGRKDFRDLILGQREKGKTVFFSSHILSDAEMIADRVGIVNRGKMVRQGTLDEVAGKEIHSIEVTFMLSAEARADLDITDEQLVSQGNHYLLRLDHENMISATIAMIEKAGGRITSIIPRKKNLEEIFMDEVGEE